MSEHDRNPVDPILLPGRNGIRDRLWSARHDRVERRIRRRIERVKHEHERLRRDLHALNHHLIQGMQPASRRDDWKARQIVMVRFLDPTLDHVERDDWMALRL